MDDASVTSDPELAKYLNRDYWEQRKIIESPASPSAPSPMSQTSSIIPMKVSETYLLYFKETILTMMFL